MSKYSRQRGIFLGRTSEKIKTGLEGNVFNLCHNETLQWENI